MEGFISTSLSEKIAMNYAINTGNTLLVIKVKEKIKKKEEIDYFDNGYADIS